MNNIFSSIKSVPSKPFYIFFSLSSAAELAKATIVFDNGASVSKEFGALTVASSMHYGRFPGHTYVVLDKEGVVRYVLDDPQMAIRNDQIINELSKIN